MMSVARTDEDALHPGSDGIWTFVFIDMMVFTLLFMVFLSERFRVPQAFVAGQRHLNPGFGLVNTLLLLTSSVFMARAVLAARGGNGPAVRARLLLCLLCGGAFVVGKLAEYSGKLAAGFGPTHDSFFTFYYFITGIHLLHVLAGMVFIAHCATRARAQTGEPRNIATLESTGLFWHFVDLVWLFIFPLLYLART